MSERTFERAVLDWLDGGSDRTPPAAIDAVLLAVKTTPQERDRWIPRRFNLMPTYARIAAGVVAAIALVSLLVFLNGRFTVGPAPTQVIEPLKTGTLEAGTWRTVDLAVPLSFTTSGDPAWVVRLADAGSVFLEGSDAYVSLIAVSTFAIDCDPARYIEWHGDAYELINSIQGKLIRISGQFSKYATGWSIGQPISGALAGRPSVSLSLSLSGGPYNQVCPKGTSEDSTRPITLVGFGDNAFGVYEGSYQLTAVQSSDRTLLIVVFAKQQGAGTPEAGERQRNAEQEAAVLLGTLQLR